jgi:sugar fermentation stimulation protein A
MRFPESVTAGRLLRRYQRFLADVEVGGETLTAHCPNTGSMLGCAEPGSPVWLSRAANPDRKYPWTWELVQVPEGALVGIHTGRSNQLVREAIEGGVVAELQGYAAVRAEVPYGRQRSRIDLLLSGAGRPDCYVEVKNVTAAVQDGVGYFPDAVTARGAKHLEEMQALVESGSRAVLCFCVQREDVDQVRPADHIDPAYGRILRAAAAAGVEAIAYGARVTLEGITLERRLPVVLP